jgi:hypothetical protein
MPNNGDTHASVEERETLSLGLAQGHSKRAMAVVLGCAHAPLTCSASATPWRHQIQVCQQSTLAISGFNLKTLQCRISWCILPIPPAPTLFDQRVIGVPAIRQDHVTKGALVLVETVGLDGHSLRLQLRRHRRSDPTELAY